MTSSSAMIGYCPVLLLALLKSFSKRFLDTIEDDGDDADAIDPIEANVGRTTNPHVDRRNVLVVNTMMDVDVWIFIFTAALSIE